MRTWRSRYYPSLTAFLVCLALLLLSIVDVRRGFLFSHYFKVGAPSVLFNLNWLHVPLVLAGLLGAWLAYRHIRQLETGFSQAGATLQTPARIVALVIGLFFVADLFIYRGVPALRTIASGKMAVGPGTLGLGWAIPVGSFPTWLQPLAEGISYILIVWHATLLGMLLGGLFLVAGASLVPIMKGSGFRSHLAGTGIALAQPFCSCCAAPVGSALYRKGASLGPVLAFTVSSPMLNITSIVLATVLLPAKLALLRIVGGIVVGVGITYAVSRLASYGPKDNQTKPGRLSAWAARIVGSYSRLFHFESLLSETAMASPGTLISHWLSMALKLAKVMVPVLIIGGVVASYIAWATPSAANTLPGVVVTSVFATLLMAPTWTEIPLAARFASDGLTGIAAVVLLALPAVSLPCLIIIAGAVRSLKVAVLLGIAVFAAAVVAGIMFL